MAMKRPVVFKRGDSGPFIADAQEMLAKLGFDPGGPEGVFVSKTEDAVRAFQREHGFEVTGVLDCGTLKSLYEEVDPGGYPATLMEGTGPVDDANSDADADADADADSNEGTDADKDADPDDGAMRGAPERTIVISVGERALGLYEGGRLMRRYPVAIGKPSTPTPVGTHRVLEKVMYPGGGLGTRWMAFTYQMHGIHGTNRPELIGQAVSNGCVRMYNENVEEIYDLVDVGTPVIVIAAPVESWPSLGRPGGQGASQPAGSGLGPGAGAGQGVGQGMGHSTPQSQRPASGAPGAGQAGGSAGGSGGTGGQGVGPAGPAGPAGGAGVGPSGGPAGAPSGGPSGGSAGESAGGPGSESGGGLWGPGSPQPKDAPSGGVPSGRTYTVQPGDSLWAIARRFGTSLEAIVRANNIANPDLIYPGDILRIP